ncbi:hypothetical protein BVRB_041510, partial [Beta vulgaris subsp. vulgaris]
RSRTLSGYARIVSEAETAALSIRTIPYG